MKVHIGTITNSSMRPEYVESLLLAKEAGAGIITKPCLYLQNGRNEVVEQFLKTDSDWLIFVDDDMSFNWEELLRLCSHEDRPIVGGLYVSPFKDAVGPVVYNWQHVDEFDAFSFKRYTFADLYSKPKDEYGLTEVDAVGTGALAIHRSVFPKFLEHFAFPTPWFDLLSINGVNMGEDMIFCARARQIGIQIYVDTSVKLSHFKTFKFHPDQIDSFIPDPKFRP